jgi:hypothetical protein
VFGKRIDHVAEHPWLGQQRRDVPKEDAGNGEVRHVADIGG